MYHTCVSIFARRVKKGGCKESSEKGQNVASCINTHFYAMCKDLRQNSVRWMTHKFVVSSDAYPMSKFDMTSPSSGDLINEQPLNLCLIDC